jgi:type VI secretion system secreted protein Hcp
MTMGEAKLKRSGLLVRRPLLAAALAASAVVPAPAMAAYDMFLKLDNVVGESNAYKFTNWIQLYSYSSGFSVPAVSQGSTGAGAGRVIGRPTCAPLSAMKLFDSSSPPLLTAAMTGQRFQKAEIDFVRSGTESGQPFLKYELQNVMVSSLQDSGSVGGDTAPTESISLTFSGMTVTYYPQTEKGSSGAPIESSVSCGLPAVQ